MKKLITYVFSVLFLSSQVLFAQERTFVLPDDLNELSGLEQLDPTTLVGINDGDDGPELYILEFDGTLRKKVHVNGAKNKDWEDLTRDEHFLYIGDIGNNGNKRKNLRIYKVRIKDILAQDTVNSSLIEIAYEEQVEFPPSSEADFNFDAEGLAYRDGQLWVFTKPNTNPWHGKSFVYRFPTKPGKYTMKKYLTVDIGPDGWWSDAITAADFHNGILYVTTYNRLIRFHLGKGLFENKTIKFEKLTQKEALLILDDNTFIIGDEKQVVLGGGNLYLYRIND
ncbi:MAG: hypothetical protein QNK23_01665 [Crocinitomicaceae bacterium]|nr:hypothetical protein [Crocinitomicaceae bacterium]